MLLPLLVAAALVPGTAEAAKVTSPEYELRLDRYDIQTVDYRFPSGLRIMFQEEHTQPIVSITNWIDRGSIVDGVNEHGESVEGIAHAVEHLAFRAKHGDLPKNWDVINQLGGILNASTSSEWTNYMTVAPVDSAEVLLRIEALRLHDGMAGVTEEDIEAEKSIVRNELRMGYESGANGFPAARIASSHLPTLLYPEGHIYRNTTIGTHETVGNITLAAVNRYVQENYRPEYSTIVMVGDLDLSSGKAITMIFEAFKDVENLLMEPADAEAYKALTDQAERDQFLQDWFPKLESHLKQTAGEPAEPRVDCDNPVEPPEPPVPYISQKKDDILRAKGMVDHPTAVAAWTMESGYCDDDVNKSVAANLLSSYIWQTLDPEYDPFAQESEIENFGCGAWVDKRSTMVLCFIEKGALNKDTPERLLDKVADSLFLQWQPISPADTWQGVPLQTMVDQQFNNGRMEAMADVLSQTDNVASLYGRSFAVSQHAHYTGRPTYFSDTITSYNTLSREAAVELARQYLTRERMVGMIIEPMDEEERERLEAGSSEADKENDVSGQHRAKEDKSRQLFDPDTLTPEVITGVTVVPDRSKMKEFTLDNGLHVTVMNHGEAPLVKVGLYVEGSNAAAPHYGLNSLAEYLHSTGRTTQENPKQHPMSIAGWTYKGDNTVYGSASSANLEALLHKTRMRLEDFDWKMANKAQRIKKWKGTAKGDGKKPETWASRMRSERVFPGHSSGTWMSPDDYDALAEVANLDTVKHWTHSKWRPGNAHLVVVGKIDDMDQAAEWVETYYGNWEYQGSDEPLTIEPPAAPQQLADRQVLVFDKPISTQSKVTLSCQLKNDDPLDTATFGVIGEGMSFLAFERLREEKGITYGAYGYPRDFNGPSAELIIGSVIQNDGVGFGVKAFFNLVAEAADGDFDEAFIATQKWNVARTMVTRQQSGDQMLDVLLDDGRRADKDYWDKFPEALASVSTAKVQTAMSTCKGHEVVTVVGPAKLVTPLLDEEKIAYEVVDWEALHLSTLTEKEQKAYYKAKAKEEAEKAKQEAEEGSG